MTKLLKRIRAWQLRRQIAQMRRRLSVIRDAAIADPATRFHLVYIEATAVGERFIADARARLAALERA